MIVLQAGTEPLSTATNLTELDGDTDSSGAADFLAVKTLVDREKDERPPDSEGVETEGVDVSEEDAPEVFGLGTGVLPRPESRSAEDGPVAVPAKQGDRQEALGRDPGADSGNAKIAGHTTEFAAGFVPAPLRPAGQENTPKDGVVQITAPAAPQGDDPVSSGSGIHLYAMRKEPGPDQGFQPVDPSNGKSPGIPHGSKLSEPPNLVLPHETQPKSPEYGPIGIQVKKQPEIGSISRGNDPGMRDSERPRIPDWTQVTSGPTGPVASKPPEMGDSTQPTSLRQGPPSGLKETVAEQMLAGPEKPAPELTQREQVLWAGPLYQTSTTTTSPMSAPVLSANAPQQVASQLADAVVKSSNQITEVSLNPEELGRVRMVVSGGETQISVSILAERSETAELIRRHLDTLTQEFRQLGYKDINFSFGENGGRDSQKGHRADGAGSSDQQPSETPHPSSGRVSSHAIDILM